MILKNLEGDKKMSMEIEHLMSTANDNIQAKKESIIKTEQELLSTGVRMDLCEEIKQKVITVKDEVSLTQNALAEIKEKSTHLPAAAQEVLINWANNELMLKIDSLSNARTEAMISSCRLKILERKSFELQQKLRLELAELDALKTIASEMASSYDQKIKMLVASEKNAILTSKNEVTKADDDFIAYLFGNRGYFGSYDCQQRLADYKECYKPLPISYERLREIADSDCPFTPNKKVKETHFLHLSPGKSLNYWHNWHNKYFDGDVSERIERGGLVFNSEMAMGWHLTFMGVVPDSADRTWDEQNALLDKTYYIPSAIEYIEASLLYRTKNACFAGLNDEEISGRTSEITEYCDFDSSDWKNKGCKTDTCRVCIEIIDEEMLNVWESKNDGAKSDVGIFASRRLI